MYLFFVMPYMGLCKVVFKMVYCTLTLRIIRSVYINHFETTTNPDYMRGHNQKKDTHTLDFDVTLPPSSARETHRKIACYFVRLSIHDSLKK